MRLVREKDGKTTMTVTVLAASMDVRDAVLASGMEHGGAEIYDRLAALVRWEGWFDRLRQ